MPYVVYDVVLIIYSGPYLMSLSYMYRTETPQSVIELPQLMIATMAASSNKA